MSSQESSVLDLLYCIQKLTPKAYLEVQKIIITLSDSVLYSTKSLPVRNIILS